MERLPIDSLRDGIRAAIDGGERLFVVSAPTGSGKSTRLPVMLSEKLGGRILVLQPRRVAARMLAKSVSSIFGMGDAVGWHVRFDKHYGDDTRIVFLTEGILARMILADPTLGGVSAIVFDEFHERNLYADLSLALAMRTREILRPDLLIAVCSASMDSDSIAEYLGGARKFECGSRLYPVDIEYAPPPRDCKIWDAAAREFDRLAREESEGNFLVFMAGAYEIGKTVSKILECPRSKGFEVCALHGELPPEKQDAVLADNGRRKVIVATNIAETSLTISGVRFVIDSGLARVARFDSARGVNTLLCERISLASATQRAGRAGRTCAGRVVRLWRKSEEEYFERYTPSEISRLDLSQIMLWLRSSGVSFDDLKLFENPPIDSLVRAVETLKILGATDSRGNITRLGRDMAAFPTEPRYAKLLIDGARRGCLDTVSLIVALTDVGRVKLQLDDAFAEAERDSLTGGAESEPGEIARLCLLARENSFAEQYCRRLGIHSANARKALSIAADLRRLAARFAPRDGGKSGGEGEIAKCILGAFSDMVGVRLNKGTLACRFGGGRRGEIRRESRHYASDVFAALEMRETNVAGGVSIMASMIVPLSRELLAEIFPDDFSESVETKFDQIHKRVVSASYVKFRDLVLGESSSGNVDADAAAKILHSEIMAGRLKLKNMDEDAEDFIERVNFVAAVCPESGIAPIDEEAKSDILLQMCCGMSSYAEVKNADVHAALRGWLSAEQLGLLKYLAPKFAEFPNRKRPCKIRYDAAAKRATISSFFRDFFLFDPKKIKICDGKIKPTFELLAPSGRPVQTTQNLEEFWSTSWAAVKKELKARYPKHFKPDDPH